MNTLNSKLKNSKYTSKNSRNMTGIYKSPSKISFSNILAFSEKETGTQIIESKRGHLSPTDFSSTYL